MGNSLFPSYIVATASIKSGRKKPEARHLGDWRELAGIAFQPTHEETKLRIEISGSRFVRPSTYEVKLVVPGYIYHVFPPLDFDYDALRELTHPTPETVTFKVTDLSYEAEGRTVTTTDSQTVTMHAISDCPLQHDGEDLTWMLGAYVNENSSVIEGILQDGLKAGIVTHFDGYQSGLQDVKDQIFAIWYVLQRRGIKYSDVTTPSAGSDKIACQTIRPLRDAITYQQANCVDGSVLFASAFRKIGLRTYLAVIPGHCFVVVLLSEHGPGMLAIETTRLGAGDPAEFPNSPHLSLEVARERSRASFNEATVYWASRTEMLNRGSGLHIIDLEKWRTDGLTPL
ncbi:MAG TPA: hypothetical protein VGM73_01775 [Candidatus Didemnitutus sp.]